MPTRSSTPCPAFGSRTMNFIAFAAVLVGAWYLLVAFALHADPIRVLRHPEYDLENLLSMLGVAVHAVLGIAGLFGLAPVFAAVRPRN